VVNFDHVNVEGDDCDDDDDSVETSMVASFIPCLKKLP